MILEGKTVLVAGVGAGLGRHVVEAALRDGANVLLAARTEAVLEQTAKEVDPSGKRVAWHRTDISDASNCQALVAVGEKRFGKVDALVRRRVRSRVGGRTTPPRNWPMLRDQRLADALFARSPAMRRGRDGWCEIARIDVPASLPQAGYAASEGSRHRDVLPHAGARR